MPNQDLTVKAAYHAGSRPIKERPISNKSTWGEIILLLKEVAKIAVMGVGFIGFMGGLGAVDGAIKLAEHNKIQEASLQNEAKNNEAVNPMQSAQKYVIRGMHAAADSITSKNAETEVWDGETAENTHLPFSNTLLFKSPSDVQANANGMVTLLVSTTQGMAKHWDGSARIREIHVREMDARLAVSAMLRDSAQSGADTNQGVKPTDVYFYSVQNRSKNPSEHGSHLGTVFSFSSGENAEQLLENSVKIMSGAAGNHVSVHYDMSQNEVPANPDASQKSQNDVSTDHEVSASNESFAKMYAQRAVKERAEQAIKIESSGISLTKSTIR